MIILLCHNADKNKNSSYRVFEYKEVKVEFLKLYKLNASFNNIFQFNKSII